MKENGKRDFTLTFNRTRLECKLSNISSNKSTISLLIELDQNVNVEVKLHDFDLKAFNRTRLECKFTQPSVMVKKAASLLIELDQNVNI